MCVFYFFLGKNLNCSSFALARSSPWGNTMRDKITANDLNCLSLAGIFNFYHVICCHLESRYKWQIIYYCEFCFFFFEFNFFDLDLFFCFFFFELQTSTESRRTRDFNLYLFVTDITLAYKFCFSVICFTLTNYCVICVILTCNTAN